MIHQRLLDFIRFLLNFLNLLLGFLDEDVVQDVVDKFS